MPENTHPARLYVVSRPETSRAVIFRRGPSRVTATYSWDRLNGRIELGQMTRKKLYARDADISPDGQWMVTFTLDGAWDNPVTRGAYRVVSRAPWLKAVHLLGVGDTYGKGWMILSEREVAAWREAHPEARFEACPPMPERYRLTHGGERWRLERAGWVVGEEEVVLKGQHLRRPFVQRASKRASLRKWCHAEVGGQVSGRGVHYETHELLLDGEVVSVHEDWEWAEVYEGRLYWASGGGLYEARVGARGEVVKPSLVHDFNGVEFQRVQAPY